MIEARYKPRKEDRRKYVAGLGIEPGTPGAGALPTELSRPISSESIQTRPQYTCTYDLVHNCYLCYITYP
jgi:hypothetical protein